MWHFKVKKSVSQPLPRNAVHSLPNERRIIYCLRLLAINSKKMVRDKPPLTAIVYLVLKKILALCESKRLAALRVIGLEFTMLTIQTEI